MSGLHKPSVTKTTVVIGGGGLVDPTVEITQPGGPYGYGEAILTDGGGSYTIAPTLRPYFISFCVPTQVGVGASVDCEHQGVPTSLVGFPVPLATNLIAIAISVDAAVQDGHAYDVEILLDPAGAAEVIGSLGIDADDKNSTFRRDLSVKLDAGAELGARVAQTKGWQASAFSVGIITIELES